MKFVHSKESHTSVRPRLPLESYVHYAIYWALWRGDTPARPSRINEARWNAMVASVQRQVSQDIEVATISPDWWLQAHLERI